MDAPTYCRMIEAEHPAQAQARMNDPTATKTYPIYTCSNTHTDYFRLLNECLRKQGLRCTAVTQLSEREYRMASRRRGVAKVYIRLQMYLVYPLRLIGKAMFASSRVTFVITSNTFYAPLLVALVGLVKRFKTVHLLYDLYPDAIEVSSNLPETSLVSRVLGSVTRWTQRLCNGSVYLGDFLRAHAERRWGRCQAGCTIHIGANPELFRLPHMLPSVGPIWLHYGGQIGLMHDADALIACVKAIQDQNIPNIRFSFLVSGAHAKRLKNELGSFSVDIGDAIPSEEWRQRIRSFHVGLVSLSPGGATVCLPSKTYAMMAGGLAIIAICPRWSDLATLVLEHEAGWVINNSPYRETSDLASPDYLRRARAKRPDAQIAQEFVQLIREVLSERHDLERKRQNALRAADTVFRAEYLAPQWKSFLQGIQTR